MSKYETDPLFEEMLNRVDGYRAVQKAIEYTSTPLSARNIDDRAWDKTPEATAQIKTYLGAMDPVISACLLSMSTKTWGVDGFDFTKSGPGVTSDTFIRGVTINGRKSITDIDLINPQGLRERPFKKLTDVLDFSYRAGPTDKVNGDYQFYKVQIQFRDIRPYWLGTGDMAVPIISGGYDLRKHPEPPSTDEIRRILSSYYIKGPTIQDVSVWGQGEG